MCNVELVTGVTCVGSGSTRVASLGACRQPRTHEEQQVNFNDLMNVSHVDVVISASCC